MKTIVITMAIFCTFSVANACNITVKQKPRAKSTGYIGGEYFNGKQLSALRSICKLSYTVMSSKDQASLLEAEYKRKLSKLK